MNLYYDELSRIEKNYGSVAEYNRSKFEDFRSYEPTELENKISNIHSKMRQKCKEAVTLPVTKNIQKEFKELKNKNLTHFEFLKEKNLLLEKIPSLYGYAYENSQKYNSNTAFISVPFEDYGQVHHKYINCIKTEDLMKIHNDLSFVDIGISTGFTNEDGKNYGPVTNLSTTDFRLYYAPSMHILDIDAREAIFAIDEEENKLIEEVKELYQNNDTFDYEQ